MKIAPAVVIVAFFSLSLLGAVTLLANAPPRPKTEECVEDASHVFVCAHKVRAMKPATSFLVANSVNDEPAEPCIWSCETKAVKGGFVETCKGAKPACGGMTPW